MENYKKKLLERYPDPGQNAASKQPPVNQTKPEKPKVKSVAPEKKTLDTPDTENLRKMLHAELEQDLRKMQGEVIRKQQHPMRPWLFALFCLSVIAAVSGWSVVYWLQTKVRPSIDGEMAEIRQHAQNKMDEIFASEKIQTVIEDEVRDYSREKVEAFVETQGNEMLNPWYGKIQNMTGELKSESEKALNNLNAVTEVLVLEARAKNDDRQAFEKLLEISRDRNHAYKTVASDAVKQVFALFNTMDHPVIDVKDPSREINLEGLAFEKFRDLYSQSIPLYRPWILTEMWRQEKYTKFQKMDFLDSVIRNDSSISALERSLRLMDFETGIKKPFTAYDFYLTWWADHKSQYKNG